MHVILLFLISLFVSCMKENTKGTAPNQSKNKGKRCFMFLCDSLFSLVPLGVQLIYEA